MADQRAGRTGDTRRVADEDTLQTAGRKANAAQPLNAAKDNGGPERYPAARAGKAGGRERDH